MTRSNSVRLRAGVVAVGSLLITTALSLANVAIAEAATSITVGGNSDGNHSEATCPKDTRLIGGGFRIVGLIPVDPQESLKIWENGPSLNKPNTWAVSNVHGFGAEQEIQALALCETNK